MGKNLKSYTEGPVFNLRPVSSASLMLFIKVRMAFESLCLGQNVVKLWKGEFVLAQILAILVSHLPTWVILRCHRIMSTVNN